MPPEHATQKEFTPGDENPPRSPQLRIARLDGKEPTSIVIAARVHTPTAKSFIAYCKEIGELPSHRIHRMILNDLNTRADNSTKSS